MHILSIFWDILGKFELEIVDLDPEMSPKFVNICSKFVDLDPKIEVKMWIFGFRFVNIGLKIA